MIPIYFNHVKNYISRFKQHPPSFSPKIPRTKNKISRQFFTFKIAAESDSNIPRVDCARIYISVSVLRALHFLFAAGAHANVIQGAPPTCPAAAAPAVRPRICPHNIPYGFFLYGLSSRDVSCLQLRGWVDNGPPGF